MRHPGFFFQNAMRFGLLNIQRLSHPLRLATTNINLAGALKPAHPNQQETCWYKLLKSTVSLYNSNSTIWPTTTLYTDFTFHTGNEFIISSLTFAPCSPCCHIMAPPVDMMKNGAFSEEKNYPGNKGYRQKENTNKILSTPHPAIVTVFITAIYSCAACGLH